jgi:MSHA pilin protein MshD
MVRKQAMAIAESMMEEVSLMPFAQDGWSGAATPANRASFDDARDYNGFQTSGIYRIEDATLIAGLENYTVNVAVVTAAVGGVAGALGITVTVTGPIDTNYALTGYKFDY